MCFWILALENYKCGWDGGGGEASQEVEIGCSTRICLISPLVMVYRFKKHNTEYYLQAEDETRELVL